jgi:hypothetical protein
MLPVVCCAAALPATAQTAIMAARMILFMLCSLPLRVELTRKVEEQDERRDGRCRELWDNLIHVKYLGGLVSGGTGGGKSNPLDASVTEIRRTEERGGRTAPLAVLPVIYRECPRT